MFKQFLREPSDIQHNHYLYQAQVLTLMQPTMQKHGYSALSFLVEFKSQTALPTIILDLGSSGFQLELNIP
jgi:hypothetical protein